MTIDSEFNLNQTVYLKTDEDQSPRLITGITLRQFGIVYELSCGVMSTWHYPFEISEDKQY